MPKTIKTIFKILAFFGLGFGVLYLVFRNQQTAYEAECALKGIAATDCSLMDKLIADVSGANFGWIALVVLCFMISNLSRALRWNMLLKPLGVDAKLYNTFGSIIIAYFANLTIPRSGEVIRSVMIAKYEDVKVEEAMGTIVTDRIFDVISLLIVIGLAFFTSFGHMSNYFTENMDLQSKLGPLASLPVLGSIAAIGIAILVLLYRSKDRIIQTKVGQKVFNIVSGFGEGLKTVKDIDNPLLFLFYSVMIWLMYYVMTFLCFYAFAPTEHLGLVAGLVVFVFGSLGIVFPSPGGMGSYHYLVGEALGLYGISGTDAFSFANIVFLSINLFCNVFFGLIFVILLPILNKKTSTI